MFKSEIADAERIRKTGLYHRVRMPKGAQDGVAQPTVLLVHGRAGNAELMWSFAPTFRALNPITIAVQAELPDPIGGYSWWTLDAEQLSATSRQTKEAQLEPPILKVERFIAQAMECYPINPRALYVLGFSQGAAIVATLSLKRPELFCGVGMLAGFIPKIVIEEFKFVAPDVRNLTAELPRYFIAHGTKDEVVPLNRAERAKDFFKSFGAQVELVTDDVGHKVGSQGMKALRQWFERSGCS